MCRRFNCLPSQIYAEDAELLVMLREEQEAAGDGDWEGGDW